MQVKKREVVETVYEAEDGTQFLKKEECEAYEGDLKNTKVFRVFYCPDTTEKGTLEKSLLLAVKAEWSHERWAELWCEKRFGSRVDFVQGVAICQAWRIAKDEVPILEAYQLEKDGMELVRPQRGDASLPTWIEGRPSKHDPVALMKRFADEHHELDEIGRSNARRAMSRGDLSDLEEILDYAAADA